MSLPIVFLRAAQVEFELSADWYEQRRTGRGAKFMAAVNRVLRRLADHPELHAKVFEDIRQANLTGYPYGVYYRVESDQIVILAVFHAARDPSIWQNRL